MVNPRAAHRPARWQVAGTRLSDAVVVLLLVASATISTIDLTVGLDRFAWLAQRIPQITLLALSLFFASALLERKSLLERTHRAVEANGADLARRMDEFSELLAARSRFPVEVATLVRSTRREIPLLPLLKPARESILVGGTTLIHFAEHYRALLIEKSMTCHVRILLLDGGNGMRQVHLAAGRLFGEEDSFHRELRRSQEAMIALAREARQQGGRFDVRSYDIIPTVNVIMVDTKAPDGRIQVELLPYRASANLRPGLVLRPGNGAEDDDLFAYFLQQYELLWSVSRDVVG
ncbi:hypothetical protein [Micromonospora okii]|uniref:hypothetical protein n=1 Tax=Micromonospora okii TaxID=1182970 RepID=UPI001E32C2E4|nr:hypothetical protein [Micromonospora okii]